MRALVSFEAEQLSAVDVSVPVSSVEVYQPVDDAPHECEPPVLSLQLLVVFVYVALQKGAQAEAGVGNFGGSPSVQGCGNQVPELPTGLKGSQFLVFTLREAEHGVVFRGIELPPAVVGSKSVGGKSVVVSEILSVAPQQNYFGLRKARRVYFLD